MPKLEELAEIRRVTLRPGDIIVLKPRTSISRGAVVEIREMARERFPDNEVVILNDMDMEVLSPDG